MKKVSLLLLLISIFNYSAKAAAQGSYYSNSLQDCFDLQNLFDYTFNPQAQSEAQQFPYASKYEQSNQIVTCNLPGLCPDGVIRNTCKWLRFLSFNCNQNSAGDVTFQIATNSLPNHCYYAQNSQPIGSENDRNVYGFSGLFNLPVKDMSEYDSSSDQPFYQSEVSSQSDLNTQLCDNEWAKSDNIDDAIEYSEGYVLEVHPEGKENIYRSWNIDQTQFPLLRLPNSDSVVGVALNGVFLFSGTSDIGYDAFFPKSFGQKNNPRAIETDICLGTSRTYNTYRYHIYSPCIFDVPLREVAAPCDSKDYPTCGQDVRVHALQNTPANVQTLTPIGIAKDGRIIYGPFKSDGSLWQPCDVDVCNGVRFSKYYGYVSTMFHPYFVGCWGPGNRLAGITQQCSSNGRKCSSNSFSFTSSLFMLLITATLAYL